jgi:ParB family chromosome partitioning protein
VARPGYWDTSVRALADLRAKDAKDPLTSDEHASCPGHAAWIDYNEDGCAAPVYVCRDFTTHGHLQWVNPATKAERTPMNEDERAARRQVVEQRRLARCAGSAPRVAGHVRRTQGRTQGRSRIRRNRPAVRHRRPVQGQPDGAHPGRHLARAPQDARQPRAHRPPPDPRIRRAPALALTLAAIEESSTPCDWCHPGGLTGHYLIELEAWGYTLSEIEHTATGRAHRPQRSERVRSQRRSGLGLSAPPATSTVCELRPDRERAGAKHRALTVVTDRTLSTAEPVHES